MTTSGTVRLRAPVLAVAMTSIAYVVLWSMTTQRPDVRAVVPFGEDPFDLFASIAIILLPLVGGLTVIRILRYGPSHIPAGAIAARIVLGMGICLGLVSLALAAAIVALVRSPMDGPGIPLAVGLVSLLTIAAWISLAHEATGRATRPAPARAEPEPDALDDVVALIPITDDRRDRIARTAERVRRHRTLVGVGAAILAGVAAVAWHALREGAWASPAAAVVYGGILVAILLFAYGLLLGPLRVLRSA